jgi:hypothetical protein
MRKGKYLRKNICLIHINMPNVCMYYAVSLNFRPRMMTRIIVRVDRVYLNHYLSVSS